MVTLKELESSFGVRKLGHRVKLLLAIQELTRCREFPELSWLNEPMWDNINILKDSMYQKRGFPLNLSNLTSKDYFQDVQYQVDNHSEIYTMIDQISNAKFNEDEPISFSLNYTAKNA